MKKFDYNGLGLNEVAFFFTYQENGKHRFNLLARSNNDMGYLCYSDDGGTVWSDWSEIGFDIAGGPQVWNINDLYVLCAREQNLAITSYLMFSRDGKNWSNRILLGNAATSYATMAELRSGKIIVMYSKEFSNIGTQNIREFRSLPFLPL